MTSDVNVERRVATSLMSPSLLCLLLLTITIDAAPAPDVVSDLAGNLSLITADTFDHEKLDILQVPCAGSVGLREAW